jgi:N6-L-threonylcarbamoyladenine synthase
MLALSIETSCDDTSIALVKAQGGSGKTPPVFEVLKSIVSSQTDIHRHWGGVVPNLAKREHEKNLPIVYKQLLEAISYKLEAEMIAVTVGPGLEPALWAGIEFAKKLSADLKIPLVGANHLEGHLYSSLLSPISYKPEARSYFKFPAVILLVSGGHTMLVLMKSIRSWKVLGETRDDAVGEAFDKSARLLGLPYPGGPEIEKLAAAGNPRAIKFPRPMVHEKNYDFSFSGLKTAVLYHLKTLTTINYQLKTDVAASFQQAAIDVLAAKTKKAALEFGAQSIFLCGGVAANRALRESLQKTSGEVGARFFAPAQEYNTDNAAMIAAAAYMRVKSRKKNYPLEADSSLSL